MQHVQHAIKNCIKRPMTRKRGW